MLRLIAATVIAVSVIILSALAHAQPPAGADPDSPTGQWFKALVRDDGMSCCEISDCRPAGPGDLRANGDGLEVKLESKWEDVPEYKIVRREDNPIGKSIICKGPSEVYCVVPYSGL